ncbi:hypothetical protein AAHZ94_16800 [Streptomyces sp. HSW2009]|uniref:hypothetical protein n=1 Tax=Streptomyces sp. HSW2009 TaxID=3142890 RepID=UPI0032ECFA0F
MGDRMRTRAAELIAQEPGPTRVFAESAAWCRLAAAIPEPPPEARQRAGNPRLRPRRRPVCAGLSALTAVLLTPLLIAAALEGWEPTFTRAERQARRAAREALKSREARARELGLYDAFDGDWSGTAGHTLLSWYEQAPDAARLLVPTSSELVLLAAPSRAWARGRVQCLEVLARIPYATARPDVPHVAGRGVPRCRLTFADGSWLALLVEDDPGQIDAFFRTCRSQARRDQYATG